MIQSDDSFSLVIIKNVDCINLRKLNCEQIDQLQKAINSLPDTVDGLTIKLAFADSLIDMFNQISIKNEVNND